MAPEGVFLITLWFGCFFFFFSIGLFFVFVFFPKKQLGFSDVFSVSSEVS